MLALMWVWRWKCFHEMNRKNLPINILQSLSNFFSLLSYAAVAFFYRRGQPLVLCEIATSRFRFFEDVDLLLPAELKSDIVALQDLWVNQLLRHRAAVLAAVWRSDDPLGVKSRSEKATVHVFSSSGWSSRHNQPKISLHFVWPDLVCTPREAKGRVCGDGPLIGNVWV